MFSRKLWISLVALIAINSRHVEGQNFGDFIPPFMDIFGGFVPRSQQTRDPLQSQGYLAARQFGPDSLSNSAGNNQAGLENVPEMFSSRRSPRHHGRDEIDGSGIRSFPGFDGLGSGDPSFGQGRPGRAGGARRPDRAEGIGGIPGQSDQGRPVRPERPVNGLDVVVQPGSGQDPGANVGLDTAEEADNKQGEPKNDQAEMIGNSQV